jgi:hypothetical protein
MANVKGIPDRREGLAVGTKIAVKGPGGERKFFEIMRKDNIFYRDSHSALSSGSTESFTEITNLDPPPTQIFQIHDIIVDGNVEVQIKQPAATNRWGTQKAPTGGYLLDKYSSLGSGQLLNLWISEDFAPNVQLVNNTDISITPTLWWIGFRYEVKSLEEEPDQVVEVSVSPPGE